MMMLCNHLLLLLIDQYISYVIITINRLHSHDLQAQVAKLTNQLAESDRLLANRTAELEAHLQTTAMATGGDTKLQAQMNTLLLEKVGSSHVMSGDLM